MSGDPAGDGTGTVGRVTGNIPAELWNPMRGVRFVGKLLLDRADLKSKAAARGSFERHARFAASAEKTPDDEHLGWPRETVYCAVAAARAGAIDAVERQFLPTMTPKERQESLLAERTAKAEPPNPLVEEKSGRVGGESPNDGFAVASG